MWGDILISERFALSSIVQGRALWGDGDGCVGVLSPADEEIFFQCDELERSVILFLSMRFLCGQNLNSNSGAWYGLDQVCPNIPSYHTFQNQSGEECITLNPAFLKSERTWKNRLKEIWMLNPVTVIICIVCVLLIICPYTQPLMPMACIQLVLWLLWISLSYCIGIKRMPKPLSWSTNKQIPKNSDYHSS